MIDEGSISLLTLLNSNFYLNWLILNLYFLAKISLFEPYRLRFFKKMFNYHM